MTTSRKKRIVSCYWMNTKNNGFTLIELMIVIVIVAIGVAIAVPSYENIIQKRRLTTAAMEVAAFLSLTQGAAVKLNEVVAVSVERNGAGTSWCLGATIRTAADDHCDCMSTVVADGDYCDFNVDGAGAPILINEEGFSRLTMNSSRVGGAANSNFNFNFDPVRGTKILDNGIIDTDTHDISLISENSKYSLRVDISVTGRVQVCNPDSDKKVPGFNSC